MNQIYQYSNLAEPDINHICKALATGGVGVLPTDTIYGLHGSVKFPETIERVYRLKDRDSDKPFIILISSILDLDFFQIKLDDKTKDILQKIWPNPVSVVLSCPNPKFAYLHRSKKTLAFRMPKDAFLLKILKMTGPLVSTSVNLAGDKSASTVREAESYFGDQIDFYIDGGELNNGSSTVISFENGKPKILRQGSFRLQNPL